MIYCEMKPYDGTSIFRNRKAVIATMHQKEKVIVPLFRSEFQIEGIVPKNFNTDQFGTFTGEIARKKNPLETARIKALAALKGTGYTLAIASEGSFGPHPESPFISGNEELIILIDTENDFEIFGRYFTEETNFNSRQIHNLKEMMDFASQIGFPEHGIILKTSDVSEEQKIFKDLNTFFSLKQKTLKLLEQGHSLVAETDMRAMRNPTRMKAIEKAAEQLIANMNSFCPNCNSPGFVITESISGLPCGLCCQPTKGIKAFKFECRKCGFACERVNRERKYQDPTFCDYCNP